MSSYSSDPHGPIQQLDAITDFPHEGPKTNLRLPCFKQLGISYTASSLAKAYDSATTFLPYQNMGHGAEKQMMEIRCVAIPLLTPPADEMKELALSGNAQSGVSTRSMPSDRPAEQSITETTMASNTTGRALGINFPGSASFTDQTQLQYGPWVTRASQKILAALHESCSLHQIQLISQTMPSQAREGRSKPTFEDVLETIQLGLDTAPFITITHAVPEARVMDELPKTPPSTPNPRHEIDDYFGNYQTIFTHAAVVPIYHNHGRVEQGSPSQLPHHIAAPYSIQISILERYIPPTMPTETSDFFSLSAKSYLVDRLSELSADNGSLLLVYPTQAGGRTFMRKYVGPILDPLLRQFILLNNLTSNAASMMGTMTAVEEMLDFKSMQHRVEAVCQGLTQRPAIRGQKTNYRIIHSEAAEVVLDRSVWINWFIEQEQPRMRQNLVQYHQSGERMPCAQGNQEVTTGMLTREVIDGLRASKEAAGATGIEVGIFVITRSVR